jgi:hypothetical protein
MSFSNPYFLFGLIAVAIPIIVHLFNFRRYKIFYFSNTRFLQSILQQTHKQSKLRKLIILSMRILAFAAIVLAFARPYIPNSQTQNTGTNACIAIYVDNSFSMGNESVNGNLLDEAKEKAKAIAAAYQTSDKYMLVTNDFEPKHQQFLSQDEMLLEIESVEISPVSRTINEVFSYISRDMNRQNAATKKIYYLSDFQTANMDLEKISLDSNIKVYLSPLKTNKINNLYIDTLWLDCPSPRFKQQATVHVIVKNTSEETVEKLPVRLFVNKNQKALATIDVQAKGFAETQLNFVISEDFIQNGYVEITDQPIIFDDKMYFSFSASPQSAVLSIYNQKENPFIHALFASDSDVVYQTTSYKSINYNLIKEQNLIVVEQMDNIPSGFVQEMQQYVEQGGNLLLVAPATEKTYNNALNQALGVTTFGALSDNKTAVSSLNLESSLYKNVFERYPENISLPVVNQYFVADKTVSANKESLMRLENGDDFLFVQKVGQGNVYLLAVALNEAFSNFQQHAAFVPTVYNMSWGVSFQNPLYNVIGANTAFKMSKFQLSNEAVLEIKSVNNTNAFIPEMIRNMQGVQLLVRNQIRDAGNYLVSDHDSTVAGISFNYNRKESDMSFHTQKAIEEYIAHNPLKNMSLMDIQYKSATVIAQQINSAGTQLYTLFIVLALLFLLAETVLLRVWKV